MKSLQETLATIVQAIVNYPDAVFVDETVGAPNMKDDELILTITVDPSDMGTLIGKQGQMIEKIRHIIKTAGVKNRQFVMLKVTDPRLQAK